MVEAGWSVEVDVGFACLEAEDVFGNGETVSVVRVVDKEELVGIEVETTGASVGFGLVGKGDSTDALCAVLGSTEMVIGMGVGVTCASVETGDCRIVVPESESVEVIPKMLSAKLSRGENMSRACSTCRATDTITK